MAVDTLSAVPQAIAATADGNSHEIQFDGGEFNVLLREDQLAKITVVTGTFKFNVGGPCTETNATYTDDDTETIPFINGVKNIFYQCTVAGSFKISFIGL